MSDLTQSPPQAPKKRLAWWGIVLIVLFALTLLFVTAQLILNAVCFVVYVDGRSMEQTLHDGDYVYAQRGIEAQRGDIIVIDVSKYQGYHEEIVYIKRLVGLEGDTLYCKDGIVYRKMAGEEQFTALVYAENTPCDYPEVTVGEGEMFFLGDNRSVSLDSFPIGRCYRVEDIIGVVPQWAVDIKGFSTGYEGTRVAVAEWLKNIFNAEED